MSAFFDGELPHEVRTLVASHVASCAACAEELAMFEKLADMSVRWKEIPVPSRSWNELEAKLDAAITENAIDKKPTPASRPRRLPRRPAVFVALVTVVVVGVLVQRTWFTSPEHGHAEMHIAHFLDEFGENPEEAQQFLLTKFQGQKTTLREVAEKLQYEPVIAKGLPAGFSFENVYLLKMPCCDCSQTICRCADGRSVAVFEHDEEHSVSFGDRPTEECLCNGKPTRIVQIDGRWAATWKQGKRYITIVGAQDREEVERFVKHLSGSKPSG